MDTDGSAIEKLIGRIALCKAGLEEIKAIEERLYVLAKDCGLSALERYDTLNKVGCNLRGALERSRIEIAKLRGE